MEDPDWRALEKLCYRIQCLVQDSGATVEWNPKGEKDPDTKQARQMDVLITSADGRRTTVECRNYASKQDVKWIEELIGRKMSLKLDGMIAVAPKGFTEPARIKAACFGIILYDFDRLNDKEIASWGRVANVESDFVQFKKLQILAVVSNADIANVSLAPNFTYGGRDGYGVVMDALRDSVENNPDVDIVRQLDVAGYAVDGVEVALLCCTFRGTLVTKTATCTYVAMVDSPERARQLREVGVQRFEHSVHEIVHHAGKAHLIIDFSGIPSPPNSILHASRINFSEVTTVEHYELVGEKRIQVQADQIELIVGVHKENS